MTAGIPTADDPRARRVGLLKERERATRALDVQLAAVVIAYGDYRRTTAELGEHLGAAATGIGDAVTARLSDAKVLAYLDRAKDDGYRVNLSEVVATEHDSAALAPPSKATHAKP